MRMLLPPTSVVKKKFAVSAKMWYSGSGVRTISEPSVKSLPIQARAWRMFAMMFRWVSIAPLATPVVPPVY